MKKIKVKKLPRIYPNEHKERFAVVRKLKENRRYYCNFRILYETREEAETEAKRMCDEHKQIFFVIEVQSYARLGKKAKATNADSLDMVGVTN